MTTTTTTTERQYTSDHEAYEIFVGQITPEEFIAPFVGSNDPTAEAIRSLLSDWPWEETAPSWLEDALYRYVEDSF